MINIDDAMLRTIIDEVVMRAIERTPVPRILPGTVVDASDLSAVEVVMDGDGDAVAAGSAAPIVAASIIGAVAVDCRVMVCFNPPSGALIIGTIDGCPGEPFTSGLAEGARADVESCIALQTVIDSALYDGAPTPLARTIQFPAGSYPTDCALQIIDPLDIDGVNRFGTRLRFGDLFPAGAALLNFVKTADSIIYGDELHVPAFGLHRITVHGNDRAVLAHGMLTEFFDRGAASDVQFRWIKGSGFKSNDSLRESAFYRVDFWGCGSDGYPVLDLYQQTTSDGHNLNRYVSGTWFSLGDHVRIGSTVSASVVRSTSFSGCTFHGVPEIYDGFGDSLDTAFTDPVMFDDEGAMPCRFVVENGQGIELNGCDLVAPGRGQPTILISEGVLGAAAINHLHVNGGIIKNRPLTGFWPRVVGTVDTALDTISTLEYGVPTLERHHMSTGSRIQFSPGTPPAPLVVATNYYVIRVDDRYFKLATTRANAIAGTAINLTSAGSGLIVYDQYDQYVDSVSTALDVLTSANHRMADEACVQFGTDGGSLPTGIAAATDYFVKRCTAAGAAGTPLQTKDNFKVATSRPNLRNGIFVNITAAGSSVFWIPQSFHIEIERGQLTLTGGTVFEDFPRACIKLRSAAATVKIDTTTISKQPTVPLIEDSTGSTTTHVTEFDGAIRLLQNNTPIYATSTGAAAWQVMRLNVANVLMLGDITGAGFDAQVFGNAIVDVLINGVQKVRVTSTSLTIDAALDHNGTTVGFYGTAPIAKQLGVAVTAAGVHAALVALGLIT